MAGIIPPRGEVGTSRTPSAPVGDGSDRWLEGPAAASFDGPDFAVLFLGYSDVSGAQ